MIRDDGANGFWISNPNNPAQMYKISRAEFDSNWVLEVSGDQQDTKNLSDVKWGKMGQPTEHVAMNTMQKINTFRTEVNEVGDRSENTDREAMKREILGQPVLDADFSGDPVAANTMSVSTFEADRAQSEADVEMMEAREAELSGSFQEFDAQTSQLDDDGDDDAAEAPEAPAEEPMAGNEDPIEPERTEEAGKAKAAAKASKAKK